MINGIVVIELDSTLVVDSRLIAKELGIQHKNLFGNICNHKTAIEYFGAIAFETREFTTQQGNVSQEQFVYLNEEQATFVMTLSRNTPKVIKCKQNLVRAFFDARQAIKDKFIPTCQAMDTEIQALKAEIQRLKKDHVLVDDDQRFRTHCQTINGVTVYTIAYSFGDGRYVPLCEYELPEWIKQEKDFNKFCELMNTATLPLTQFVKVLNQMAKQFKPSSQRLIGQYHKP